MFLNAAEWKGMCGLMQDPQLTMRQSEMAMHDPDTQVIPEGRASLVDWVKATVKSVYPEKENCLTPPTNARQSAPEAAVDMVHTQAMWSWRYDNQGIHPHRPVT